jgi:hypothetical protein
MSARAPLWKGRLALRHLPTAETNAALRLILCLLVTRAAGALRKLQDTLRAAAIAG